MFSFVHTNIRIYAFVIFITISVTSISTKCSAQDHFISEKITSYTDKIYDSITSTVKLGIKNTPFSYPILSLNSNALLELKFDRLTANMDNLLYTIIHCDANWKPSDISQYEYLDGFYEYAIEEFYASLAVQQEFVQYRLSIPNEDISFKLSGNYLLIVFADTDEQEVILTRRFMVYDNQLNIKIDFRRPASGDFFERGQEIPFTLEIGNLYVADIYNDLSIKVLQNYNWNTMKEFKSPQFVRENELIYDFGLKNTFLGLKEQRYFDIRSMRFYSLQVKDIQFRNPNYHVNLYTDKIRSYKPYLYNEDFNGRYYIEVQEYNDNELNSEYVWVNFELDYQVFDPDANIYIFGELSNYELNEKHKLQYDFNTQTFKTKLFLKQGYYNYTYVYKERNRDADFTYLEGSSYETENDYLFLVYKRGISDRYDRLIGFEIFNTINRK
jgi:hypothetical protein